MLLHIRGGRKVFGFIKKTTSYGIEEIYLLYIIPPWGSTHLWLRCSNFFNPSKKNSFDYAAIRKIGNRKSQGLIRSASLCVEQGWPELVSRKSFVFWDIKQCSPLKINRCFGVTFHFLYQSGRIYQVWNQHEIHGKQRYLLHIGFFSGLLFYIEDGGDVFLWNVCRGWTYCTAFYPIK
jgi:hypothetical protein